MGVSIFLRTSGFAIVLAWGVCKKWRVCIFYAQSVKNTRVCKIVCKNVKCRLKASWSQTATLENTNIYNEK